MKRLICIFFVMGFSGTIYAEFERNPYYDNWLTPERLDRWQGLSQNMTYHNMYVLIEEMYYLPKEPWSEEPKQILLKMAMTYRQMLKDRTEGKPIIVPDFAASDKCGELVGSLYDMVTWQKDPRFLFFFEDFRGGGAAVDGLAGIGEPAFGAVIKAFDREGYAVLHWEARRFLSECCKRKIVSLRRIWQNVQQRNKHYLRQQDRTIGQVALVLLMHCVIFQTVRLLVSWKQ